MNEEKKSWWEYTKRSSKTGRFVRHFTEDQKKSMVVGIFALVIAFDLGYIVGKLW